MARWNSDTLKNGVQVGAILAAGSWAVYEFDITQGRLSFKLNPSVSATLGPEIPAKGEVPMHRPVSFSIEMHNVGEEPGQIVLAALSVTGNINGATDGTLRPEFALGSSPTSAFAMIDWAAARADVAYTFFSPGRSLQAGETIGDAPVVLIANAAAYDSLSHFLIVWAIGGCRDPAGAACGAFGLQIDGVVGVDCEPSGPADVGGDYCGQFYRANSAAEPVPVTIAEMVAEHALTAYTHEGFIVLPPPVAAGAGQPPTR